MRRNSYNKILQVITSYYYELLYIFIIFNKRSISFDNQKTITKVVKNFITQKFYNTKSL